jgi:hypothetical protein
MLTPPKYVWNLLLKLLGCQGGVLCQALLDGLQLCVCDGRWPPAARLPYRTGASGLLLSWSRICLRVLFEILRTPLIVLRGYLQPSCAQQQFCPVCLTSSVRSHVAFKIFAFLFFFCQKLTEPVRKVINKVPALVASVLCIHIDHRTVSVGGGGWPLANFIFALCSGRNDCPNKITETIKLFPQK